MKRVAAGFAGFFLGLVTGYALVLFGWIAFTAVVPTRDFEGAMSMGVAFFWAPAGALVTAVLGAILFARRAGRGAHAGRE